MNGESGSGAARDDCGRFSGARFNVEQVPRLPTFPARWALEDPRGRPYLVFWTTEGGSLRYPLRMQRIDGGRAVSVTKPSGASQPIEIVSRLSPNRTGTMILYRCPKCEKPRRYLYRLAASGGRLVDYFGLQCQVCSGFCWASQGRYRNKLERSFVGVLASIYGQTASQSFPRSPWDPRAVSDPRIVVDEFPDDLLDAGLEGGDRRSAAQRRAPSTDYLNVPLKEFLEAALAAEPAPVRALPGMPKVRRLRPNCLPSNDQDQQAIEAVQQTLGSMFASTSALLQGMKFIARATS
jgi:hypothetical protein